MRALAGRLLLALAICSASTGWAETRALLIGVSDYSAARSIPDLKGPANDVRLLRDVLSTRDVRDITVIADGVDGVPTRAAILAGLQAVADRSQDGDFVMIHFSGHGTRQRDQNGDETDGFDEVILPADAMQAAPGTGVIVNAITDDEIGTAVDAIRARGANVWLVLDSCHSGTGLRAASPDVAVRFVDPSALGIEGAPVFAPAQGATQTDLPSGAGDVLAFYSAQSSELAREVNLEPGTATAAWYGLFTSRLAAQLEASPAQSFRQLFQGVLHAMNDGAVPSAARLQTPHWEGDLIDAQVFGDGRAQGIQRFELRGSELLAGKVHGLPKGTLLGVVARAADAMEAQIGVVQIEDALATRSFVRTVDASCVPRADALCPPAEMPNATARFAHVLARPIDLLLQIAPPRDLATGAALPEAHPALMALQAAVGSDPHRFALADGSYDVSALWDGSALWFGPRAQVQGQPIGLAWTPGETPLPPLLARMERAVSLSKLLGSLSGQASLLNPSPVEITGALRPVDAANLEPAGSDVPPRRECISAQSARGDAPPSDLPPAAQLKQCDGLSFSAIGAVPGARDVNRIHIDSQFCVHASYARIEDTALPSRLGPDMTVCSDCPGGYSAGDEQLFVVVTEAEAGSAPLNLGGLIETCGANAPTRAAKGAAATSFFEQVGRLRATRGNLGALGISNIWTKQFRWTVLPKPIALRTASRP